MATYAFGYGPAPVFFDLEDYSDYLFDEYLQGCVSREMPIPSNKEIQAFIETGVLTPIMSRFVKAMRDLASDFNQETYLELETAETIENLPEEMW